MNPEIAAALISVSGVLISVLSSIYIARRRSASDLKARNRDLFGSQLVQKRLTHYADLYQVLSSFTKALREPIPVQTFHDITTYVLDWDSKHSYLMSWRCTDSMYEYYCMLRENDELPPKELADKLERVEERKKIAQQNSKLESAMKSDLGILDVELNMVNVFAGSYRDTAKKVLGPSYELRRWLQWPLNRIGGRFKWMLKLKQRVFGSSFSIQKLTRK